MGTRYVISTSPLVGCIVAVVDDREEAITRARQLYLREERYGTLVVGVRPDGSRFELRFLDEYGEEAELLGS